MSKNIILIALLCLITGFILAYYIFAYSSHDLKQEPVSQQSEQVIQYGNNKSIANPLSAKDKSRLDYLEKEISLVKQQINHIEQLLQDVTAAPETETANLSTATVSNNRSASALTQRLYSLDGLIRGGIDPALAEDIIRRKNSIELKRLQLQDRAQRENYLNTQRYFDQLAEINLDDFSLREELGDQSYDEYLYNSKQNNRVKFSSVMLGSAAEEAGILSGDILLSYDGVRMFSWQEIKDATSEGQLGDYVSVNIYRGGEIYSFTVPRGPLGVQLGAARLAP